MTLVFPPGRSGSSIVITIGPSTFVPGVTSISPVVGLIAAGIYLPSSSLAVTFVSPSGLLTTTPVPWLSSVGITGFLFRLSIEVPLLSWFPLPPGVSLSFSSTKSVPGIVSCDPSG